MAKFSVYQDSHMWKTIFFALLSRFIRISIALELEVDT